jgi:hypothetical protein
MTLAGARVSKLAGCVKEIPQTDECRSAVFVEAGHVIAGRL